MAVLGSSVGGGFKAWTQKCRRLDPGICDPSGRRVPLVEPRKKQKENSYFPVKPGWFNSDSICISWYLWKNPQQKKWAPIVIPNTNPLKKKKQNVGPGAGASLLSRAQGGFESSHLFLVMRNRWKPSIQRPWTLVLFGGGSLFFPTFTRKVGGFFESVINFYILPKKPGCT